ncbi:MAG: Rieske 2Fe-2S domain-containing protein [Pirellulales bacterium]|nr:Rieske 2Fe-2S domain-containing protein [Pirellulales bacterium]
MLLSGLASAAAATVVAIPGIGYLAAAACRKLKDQVDWVNLGPVDEFPENETRLKTFVNPLGQPWDGITANTGVYVRYLGRQSFEHQFQVFAINCTHLGCPVEWFPQSGLFMCPCHGGVYYANGDHASGPPPRGLYHCEWRVNSANQLEIQAPHLPTLQRTLRADQPVRG